MYALTSIAETMSTVCTLCTEVYALHFVLKCTLYTLHFVLGVTEVGPCRKFLSEAVIYLSSQYNSVFLDVRKQPVSTGEVA